MSRSLTPEEFTAYEKQRQKDLEKISAGLGIPIEKIIEIERNARNQLRMEAIADAMTDEEFADFVEEQCNRFSCDQTRTEFRRIAAKTRLTYDDELFSLRERLTHTADAMLKSEQYYKNRP